MQVQPSDALPKIVFARFYGNSLGRFLSVDPVSSSVDNSNPQTWSRFTYVRNNPMLRIDPDGLKDTVYLQFADGYERSWGAPNGLSVGDGMRQANKKLQEAGSSVRVEVMKTDTVLDPTDRIATMTNGASDSKEGRVAGEASDGGPITLFMDQMHSDNLDTATDEAASAFGNVLAHEIGHSYGVEFDYSTAVQNPDGTLDLTHTDQPGALMSPSVSSQPAEFSEEAAKQLPQEDS